MQDGYRMPGEFEPHQGCIMIFPERPDSWQYGAYAARKAAVDAKVAFRKYSAGARMAGAWGYYAPSDVWLHAYTGRRRGCLVDAPEDSLYSYIYEYDGAGQLLRILFPARNVATYCLQNEAGGLYVTYKGYLYAA